MVMAIGAGLHEKLRRIEALYAGAGRRVSEMRLRWNVCGHVWWSRKRARRRSRFSFRLVINGRGACFWRSVGAIGQASARDVLSLLEAPIQEIQNVGENTLICGAPCQGGMPFAR